MGKQLWGHWGRSWLAVRVRLSERPRQRCIGRKKCDRRRYFSNCKRESGLGGHCLMSAIFRWNGQYFGFITNGRIFDAKSNYLGWIESDESVWRSDGHYL